MTGRTPTKTGPQETWTVLKIIRWTTEYLGKKGLPSPRLDAEVLLADLLALNRVQLYMNFDRPLNQDELAGYRYRIKRRAAREPVAYITGHKEFYSLDLKVNADVLIPRPETELLVDEALRLSAERWPGSGLEEMDLQVLDVGTGSGALVLALASKLTSTRFWATDISPSALEVARENALRLGLADRLTFLSGDLFSPLAAQNVKFHLITANLPYVPSSAFNDMTPDVRDYEPHSSLDGGPDGLEIIRRIVVQAKEHLIHDGALFLEIWWTHGEELQNMALGFGYRQVKILKDLADRDRIAVLSLE
ncbi:MAG: peptide chain release factor N(5)-glutamine methyltransferase [Deltaproteobacteria bacterium]|nr:peptide chain release factor N(5)-glutamine methyltransferase [Deltaproteobacteria bacterium]